MPRSDIVIPQAKFLKSCRSSNVMASTTLRKPKAAASTASKLQAVDFAGQVAAISRSQAVIEFQLDGTIITANDNFCAAIGYSLEEIQGRHHSLFVDEAQRQSADYREFWLKLGRGEFAAGEFKRVAKGGREIWIQATYNPI